MQPQFVFHNEKKPARRTNKNLLSTACVLGTVSSTFHVLIQLSLVTAPLFLKEENRGSQSDAVILPKEHWHLQQGA